MIYEAAHILYICSGETIHISCILSTLRRVLTETQSTPCNPPIMGDFYNRGAPPGPPAGGILRLFFSTLLRRVFTKGLNQLPLGWDGYEKDGLQVASPDNGESWYDRGVLIIPLPLTPSRQGRENWTVMPVKHENKGAPALLREGTSPSPRMVLTTCLTPNGL